MVDDCITKLQKKEGDGAVSIHLGVSNRVG
jgi:hypothetical protein